MNFGSVAALRALGYKVRVKHVRRYSVPCLGSTQIVLGKPERKAQLLEKGGMTTVQVDGNGQHFIGTARCRPDENFCRKTGVKFALARLTEQKIVKN